ncbi:MAG: DUF5681 domain-containing protein [Pseudomonadota bacterium]
MTIDENTGYASPPKTTRFQKGRSGNPRGRPKGSGRTIPHDKILGQMVTVRENGVERRITAAEAFLVHFMQQALSGNSVSARLSLDVLAKARELKLRLNPSPLQFVLNYHGLDVSLELEMLRMAKLKYATDQNRTRCELNPWIVEKALERLDWIGLSEAEQRIVWETTRTPEKVKWPDWWTYQPT